MTPINAQTLIDDYPMRPLQWRVVAICFLVAMLDGYDLQAMAFAAPAVAEDFSISAEHMGFIFSAAIFGLMIGTFIFGPLSDRIGRKPVIIIACVMMGIFSLLTATADGVFEFSLWRFLNGVGMGAAMPSLNALTAEYAPARRRSFVMTLMFVGVPFGSVVGGLFAAFAVVPLGWQSIFWLGGIAPLAFLVVVIIWLPESPIHLIRKSKQTDQIRQISERLGPAETYPIGQSFSLPGSMTEAGLSQLFAAGRRRGTLLIWSVFFINLLLTFAVISWLPSILRLVGFPMERALYVAASAGIGGMIGGLIIAWACDKFGFARVLTPASVITAAALAVTGFVTGDMVPTVIAIVLVGALVGGLQFGLHALAAQYYPAAVRSTGLGWALSVGRTGALLGPILMGQMLASGLTLSWAFLVLAAIGLIGSVFLVILSARRPHPASSSPRA